MSSKVIKSASYTEIERAYDGWAGAGFDSKFVKMQVRRVIREGIDEVQIEINITDKKGKRLYQHFGGIVLTPEQAQQLSEAVLYAHKPVVA